MIPSHQEDVTLSLVIKPVKNSSQTARPLREKILHYFSLDTICLVITRRLSNRDEGYI